MQFEAEWHAVPSGLLCCLAGIYIAGDLDVGRYIDSEKINWYKNIDTIRKEKVKRALECVENISQKTYYLPQDKNIAKEEFANTLDCIGKTIM